MQKLKLRSSWAYNQIGQHKKGLMRGVQKSVENIQAQVQKAKCIENTEKCIKYIQNMGKRSNTHAYGVPEVRQRVNRTEAMLEEVTVQNFSKLTEDTKRQD